MATEAIHIAAFAELTCVPLLQFNNTKDVQLYDENSIYLNADNGYDCLHWIVFCSLFTWSRIINIMKEKKHLMYM